MKLLYILPPLLLFPLISHASTFQNLLTNTISFVNGIVIPFLLALAFLFFVINVLRFFIIGSTEEQGREKAKALAIYSVSAFVLITIFWGLINLFATSIGLEGEDPPCPDYMIGKVGGC